MLNIKNIKIELPSKSKKEKALSARLSIAAKENGNMTVEVLFRGKKLVVEDVSEPELADGILQVIKDLNDVK